MLRSAFRSLEILLFFVISVMGASFFTRTTTFNTKSKTKSLFGAPLMYGELAATQPLPLPSGFDPLSRFAETASNEIPASFSANSSLSLFVTLFCHHRPGLPRPDYNPTQQHPDIPFQLHRLTTLFQQNPILLI